MQRAFLFIHRTTYKCVKATRLLGRELIKLNYVL